MTVDDAPNNAPNNAGLIPTLENQIFQLIDHEAWLDAQIRELEFANTQDTLESPEEVLSPEETRRSIEQRIDILKHELLTAASLESVRTRFVDSAHYYQVVLKCLFKDDQDPEEKLLADALQERDNAVSEYLLVHRDLQQARKDLSANQIQVLDCQHDNRKLIQLLSKETEAAKKASVSQTTEDNQRAAEKIEEDLRNVNIKDDIVSNVLQGLMLESGVDWVNDPHYLGVMLKLKRTED